MERQTLEDPPVGPIGGCKAVIATYPFGSAGGRPYRHRGLDADVRLDPRQELGTEVLATRLQRLDGRPKPLRRPRIPLEEYPTDEKIQAIVERRPQPAIQICPAIADSL